MHNVSEKLTESEALLLLTTSSTSVPLRLLLLPLLILLEPHQWVRERRCGFRGKRPHTAAMAQPTERRMSQWRPAPLQVYQAYDDDCNDCDFDEIEMIVLNVRSLSCRTALPSTPTTTSYRLQGNMSELSEC